MRKAFTLIELLAVIVILAIITVIAVPQILGMIERVRNNAYQLNLDLMKKAAETYVQSGQIDIIGDTATVTLDELVEKKYISPIKDPKDKSTECDGYVETEIDGKKATYTPYLKCGDNFVSEGYVDQTNIVTLYSANIHADTVPDGYIGIYKLEDLNNIRNNLSGKYILMNNLDFNSDSSYTNLSNKTTYTTGDGWIPIGNSSTSFTGILSGNNYIISNLYINNSLQTYTGLFGYVSGSTAIIEKLALTDVNITSSSTIVGSIAGSISYSTIKNSYSTGTIIGTGTYVGGLVGSTSTTSGGGIESCYSSADVTGTSYAGGLVGNNNSNIKDSYATGNVTATAASGAYYGKLVGYNNSGFWGYGRITNSYAISDSTATGTGTLDTSATVVDGAYLKSEVFLNYNLKWDVENVWDTSDNSTYFTLGGTTGTTNSVAKYEIKTIEDLYGIRRDLTGTYTLMNDLDFNSNSSYRSPENKIALSSGGGWIPIGDSSISFTGTFNGNGHTIKNLYINNSLQTYTGLFGYVSGSTAIIEKLALTSVDITSSSTIVGSIAGSISYSTIKNSYSTGTIKGTGTYAGGLVGSTSTTSGGGIESCYSSADVTGTSYAGGLVGSNNSNLKDSFATGNVTTTAASGTYYGKLAGYNSSGFWGYGRITNSYATSDSTATGTGTLDTSATVIDTKYLKSEVFLNYNLKWDLASVWNATNNSTYAKLGGTSGIVTGPQHSITKIEDLYSVRTDLAGSYTLMNDLDFNSDSSYRNPDNKSALTSGLGWLPIGDSSISFTGTFNGNGHTIKNLYINNSFQTYTGLFGYVSGSPALIEKLALIDVNITSSSTMVGGIAGSISYSTIKNSYSTGTVKGTGAYAGGLVGSTSTTSGGGIESCYSSADVTGTSYAGGLVGSNNSNLKDSFATGNVTTTAASGTYYGKLVGYNSSGFWGYGRITNSYAISDSTATGTGTLDTSATVIDGAYLKSEVFLNYNLKWDLASVWNATNNSTYAKLGGTPGIVTGPQHSITKIEDLYSIRADLAGSYTLMNDLDFNSDSSYRNPDNKGALTSSIGWIPINSFTGTLNGNGKKISNLYINGSNSSYVGLFGQISGTTALIEKLALENVNISSAATYTGGLTAYISGGTIKNSYITGTVSSTSGYVGGLVGNQTSSAIIDKCYSNSNVTGTTYVGGLVGYQYSCTISNSYSVGNVISTLASGAYFGRLVGYRSSGTITNDYYNGASTLTGTGTTGTSGISSTVTNIQPLTLTGLDTWDKTTIWQVNTGAYPTLR